MDDIQRIPVIQGEERAKALRMLEAHGFKVQPVETKKESSSKTISFFGRRTERMVIG